MYTKFNQYRFEFTTISYSVPTIIELEREYLTSKEWSNIKQELLFQVSLDKCDAYCWCYRNGRFFGLLEAILTPEGDGCTIYYNCYKIRKCGSLK